MSWRIGARTAKIVEWTALGAIPILSALKATLSSAPMNPQSLGEFFHKAFSEWYLSFVIFLGVLGLVAKIVQEYWSPESQIKVKSVLDGLLVDYFSDVPETERYTNRVTLFQAKVGKGLLVAYCRSGTQYLRGIQSFQINDDKEGANEGIAGQAWFRNSTVSKILPECPSKWSKTDPKCLKYAQEGLLPLNKAENLRVKSGSILATSVRDFKGNKWGVLVVDSRKVDGIDPNKEILVKSVAATLGKLL